MTSISDHGGACCGIRHLVGFGPYDTAEDILVQLAKTRQGDDKGMLVEAVVTNSQLNRYRNIAPALRDAGFKLVTRFKNPNSGNVCNVFHYNKVPKKMLRAFGGVSRDMTGGGL